MKIIKMITVAALLAIPLVYSFGLIATNALGPKNEFIIYRGDIGGMSVRVNQPTDMEHSFTANLTHKHVAERRLLPFATMEELETALATGKYSFVAVTDPKINRVVKSWTPERGWKSTKYDKKS